MHRSRVKVLLCVALATCVVAGARPLAAEDLLSAKQLLLTGRYAEAAEQFAKLASAGTDPLATAIGHARALAAQGKYDEAVELLSATSEKHPEAARLPAELAVVAFARGQSDAARQHVAEALKHDPSQPAARWIEAELFRTTGQLDEANQAYEWFVDFYNSQEEFKDPDTLRYIGLAAAQFARWNRLSDQFAFLVNDLYPAALKLNENYWPAHYEAGLLFLEKYNQAEATRSLQAALAINPNAPEIHAALARLQVLEFNLDAAQRSVRAGLATNPHHLECRLMQADIHLANFEPEVAAELLEKARPLNPQSEELLGRLAASYGMIDGLTAAGPDSRLGKLEAEALERNRHCGLFYYALSDALDKGRKYPWAAVYYRKAIDAMPQLVGARGQLALMYMRLGEEEKARPLLEESFEIDPFNVRVSNSLKVMEVLDEYETLETEHFLIRYDPQLDAVLARYAAQRLEEVYPEVCERMGYEPEGKSLFEIFNRAKNTDGHGWFSARMVGLPKVHTIGACAGKMVALTSPSSVQKRFNWARVLKHEFVHVVNLQQTNFNVPHWFTEALAVLLEDTPRSHTWNAMLARRVPAGEVFNLDSINRGFIRPHSSEDWQMAYCQAEIYAEYMLDTYGDDAIAKMLACYRDNLNTRDALQRSFNVSQEEFEKGYTAYLQAIVDKLPAMSTPAKEKSLSELVQANTAEPDDVAIASQLALAYLQRKSYAEAGKLADGVLKVEPQHQLASYVKARLLLLIGEKEGALARLTEALDRAAPQSDLLKLLAGLKYQNEQFDEAAALFELGRKHLPGDPSWLKSLTLVHLKTGDEAQLQSLLGELAELDPDDLAVRKKLAQLALQAKDYAAAARWANQCLDIDVLDITTHHILARALAAQENFAEAAAEYQVAIELAPDQPALRLALAKVYQQAGEPNDARSVLEALLELKPDHPEATSMLEKLEQ